jgi:hypothetical protein
MKLKVDIEFIHLKLTRYDTGEVISVTLAPTGYVIESHCESTGFTMELTDEEIRHILYSLGIDPD